MGSLKGCSEDEFQLLLSLCILSRDHAGNVFGGVLEPACLVLFALSEGCKATLFGCQDAGPAFLVVFADVSQNCEAFASSHGFSNGSLVAIICIATLELACSVVDRDSGLDLPLSHTCGGDSSESDDFHLNALFKIII